MSDGLDALSKNVERLLQNSASHEVELKNLTKSQDEVKDFLFEFKRCVEQDIRHMVSRDACEARIRTFDTKIDQIYTHVANGDEKERNELDRRMNEIRGEVQEMRKTTVKMIALSVSAAGLAFAIFQFLYNALTTG